MDHVETVLHYHERTKHHFHRFAASLGYLDWATQPDPFRRYHGSPLVTLSLSTSDPVAAYDDLFVPGAVQPALDSFENISKFFELSLALSAWKQFGQSRWALRMNPSSGNLHPTEGYLICGPIASIHDKPAVWHYAPREHALERRTEFSNEIWKQLMAVFPPTSFLVGLTSIHWREAWKYGERAFRYCQHDVGHALAALSLSAALQGWTARVLDEVSDSLLSSLLGIDRQVDLGDAEEESPDLLIAVIPKSPIDSAAWPTGVPENSVKQIASCSWAGTANRLSSNHVDWEIITQVEAATRKEMPVVSNPGQSHPSFPLQLSTPIRKSKLNAATIIRQRRSAVDFDGKTQLTAEQFYLILDRTLPRWDRTPWNTLCPPVCIDLALFVHLVNGLTPGLYYFIRDLDRLETLRGATQSDFDWQKPDGCPDHLPLYHLVTGDARKLAAQLSCQQDIAGDSAFSCGMIAEYENYIKKNGPWFYRRLFWEAGVIGQILYLEAEAAGVRGTGIGCYFDDAVHETLGLSGNQFQSLYHFTIGGPVDDLRLMTWPPYEHRA